ncbi:flagellar hook-associated protein FlgK [Pseudoalteromonas phenolica]|uniref:Flagellar hook-associated protein 1 n=1 Tax=Pseudoalteromonas phenolica TaxID=161398 RepID=A0A0S2JZH5_9GAMM|nr:flagellar hook-associated protein FlgK [Pseudoalteromonas phenolica]ALO41420.1 Flagellar hook-associated protein FlgK [Pseudoalteromonas phenolica]MBE0354034.1 flagellar hook-associated protein 1 FlgK [Pseudoalteromonas phenolica O-BC30]RXE95906.1 flagellar hook-associated protein FlgK [Pseudoalteromonas phenolica O-BC30]
MSFNLMNIGSAGIRANSELLQTTSKNISNLNTKGYIRERTEHSTMVGNQVGRGETVRLINEFAQKQLNRDISNKTYYEQFVTESSRVDTLFGEESNSLNNSINSLFNNLQEAMNLPSSTVTRSLFLTDAQNLVDQMDRLSGIVFDQNNIVNEQLSIMADEANNLIQKISDLNDKVVAVELQSGITSGNSVVNERDEAIKDLAELVDIETLDGPNGEKLVFLGSGQSLVMENGTFNTFDMDGDPDPNIKELKLDSPDGKAIELDVNISSLRGKMGGLLAFRDEILHPAQNQLGQIGLALADAFNEQNKKGMDLDGNIGGDIFSIPTVGGYAYADNTGTASVNATVEAGKGSEIPATDFRVTFTSATTVEIAAVDSKGNVIGTPSTANVTAGVIDSSTITSGESFGLEMDVSGTANTGDSFLIKLNSSAASTMELATERPESLALASPIRTTTEANNTSNATISVGSVTNTGTGSNFTASPPSLTQGDITLTKTGNANEYQIQDGNGTTTFTITPPAENILAQAGAPYDSYGFDFNIDGTAATGDVFTIEFNTGGFDDNRNGLELSMLPSEELVRQNVVTTATADNLKTFNEAYAGLVTEIGVIANQAKTNGAAFEALAEQSEAWFESMSGVNLDEEAANLLRFQQAYSASAQIITTARTVFDTLLSATR